MDQEILNEDIADLRLKIPKYQSEYIQKNKFENNKIISKISSTLSLGKGNFQYELLNVIQFPINVLIVDDNQFNTNALNMLLKQFNNI